MKRIIYWLFLPLLAFGGERAVSLSPAVSELIIYAGGRSRMCGRSSACDMAEIKDLPVAGNLGMPFPEAVLRSGASVVISDAEHPSAEWKLLKRCGIKIEILNGKKLSDLPENLRRIGDLLNLPEAEKRAAELEKKLRCLREDMPEKHLRGIIIFGVDPLISCGRTTFISDAAHLSGVKNCAGSAGDGYFILTPEFLISAAPEIILSIGVDEERVKRYFQRAVFRNIPAVSRGRIIFLNGEKWSRLTPAVLDASRELRVELFGDLQD